MLKKEYDYYKIIREKTELIINRHLYIDNINYNGYDIVYKEKFFEFITNLFNKYIYECEFVFNQNEIDFFFDLNINSILREIIIACQKDIILYKNMKDI